MQSVCKSHMKNNFSVTDFSCKNYSNLSSNILLLQLSGFVEIGYNPIAGVHKVKTLTHPNMMN